ncbi:unnamed protein product, partial [Ixodes pacificus]
DPIVASLDSETSVREDGQICSKRNAKKKKLCLHLEGYKYYKRRQNANGMVAWRCCRYTSSGCAASILTEEDNVKSRSHDHNHAPDEATLVKDQLRVALKKAAASNPNTPVPRLFQEELLRTCSAVPDEVAAEVPTFASLKDTMYRERRSAQPPLPSSATTLQLNDTHKKTESAEPFLVVDDRSDPSSCILAFATRDGMQRLSSAKIIFADGTFFVVPHIYDQLVTLHVVTEGVHSAAVYFLLSGRSRQTYVRAFQGLKAAFLSAGIAFSAPDIFMTDFEQALIGGLRDVFPQAAHRGCHFHFAQRVWASVQRAGLQSAYSSDNQLRALIRKLVALSFVPPCDIPRAWAFLHQEGRLLGIPELTGVLDYFDATWISGIFQHEQWNHHGNRGPRTNNHMEAWHRKIKGMSGKAHPNPFAFIDLIKRDEAQTRVLLLQVANGGAVRAQGRKWANKDRKLAELESRFNSGVISLFQFLNFAQAFSGL